MSAKRKAGDEGFSDNKKRKNSQKYKESYRQLWPCLESSKKGVNFVHCSVCMCDFTCIHGRRNDCKRHVERKQHKDYDKAVSQTSSQEKLGCDKSEIPPGTIVMAADKAPLMRYTVKRAAEYINEQSESKRRKPEFLSDNTRRHMNWAVSVFTEWLKENGESDFHFEYKGAAWMNAKLEKFYIDAKTLDGNPYSPESLLTFRRNLSLYLIGCPGSKGVNVSINLDPEYQSSNRILSTVKNLRRDSLPPSSKLCTTISDEDLNKLYTSKTLSDQNPVSLSWKVWFDVTYHLCKGKLPQGYWRFLTKHSLALASDANGVYYTFANSTFVLEGEEPGKMYATPCEPERCPVRTVSLYLSKLCENCDALFQYPRKSSQFSKGRWYLPIALGRDKLNKMMAKISAHAKLSKIYHNASVMKTAKFKKLVQTA